MDLDPSQPPQSSLQEPEDRRNPCGFGHNVRVIQESRQHHEARFLKVCLMWKEDAQGVFALTVGMPGIWPEVTNPQFAG